MLHTQTTWRRVTQLQFANPDSVWNCPRSCFASWWRKRRLCFFWKSVILDILDLDPSFKKKRCHLWNLEGWRNRSWTPGPSSLGAKWFLKWVKSPSLKVQLAPLGRCCFAVTLLKASSSQIFSPWWLKKIQPFGFDKQQKHSQDCNQYHISPLIILSQILIVLWTVIILNLSFTKHSYFMRDHFNCFPMSFAIYRPHGFEGRHVTYDVTWCDTKGRPKSSSNGKTTPTTKDRVAMGILKINENQDRCFQLG